jgi:hypothetical protein
MRRWNESTVDVESMGLPKILQTCPREPSSFEIPRRVKKTFSVSQPHKEGGWVGKEEKWRSPTLTFSFPISYKIVSRFNSTILRGT